MPDIEFMKVTKQYGSVIAVNDLDLTIPDGGFVTLLGPSGCGKTTTLRMIAGLEMPTHGEIRFGDLVLSSSTSGEAIPPEKRGMGLVFQSYALWPHMTIAQNILFGLQMQRKPRQFQKDRLHELTHLLHIDGLENRYPLQLSGGQQQRVALARMLAVSPQVLLLDEPLSNLDARLRMEMRAELKRLHEQFGNTIVYVTHDQMEAMTMASHVAVLLDGRLQQFAPPMEIYRRPQTLFVAEFVGSPSINLIHKDNSGSTDVFCSILDSLQATDIDAGDLARIKTIGIRPEAIRLRTQNAGSNGYWSYPARIDTILPTGPEWIMAVRMREDIFFMTTDIEPIVQIHDSIEVLVNPKEFHLFDTQKNRLTACP
jgi:iron(III) transport system ATP-binding protein